MTLDPFRIEQMIRQQFGIVDNFSEEEVDVDFLDFGTMDGVRRGHIARLERGARTFWGARGPTAVADKRPQQVVECQEERASFFQLLADDDECDRRYRLARNRVWCFFCACLATIYIIHGCLG